MAKTGRTHLNQSISFPPKLLKAARDRADKLSLPLSKYVQLVVERDLAERGAIVLAEKDPAAKGKTGA